MVLVLTVFACPLCRIVRKLEASQNPTRCGNEEVYSHSPEIRMLQRFANGSLSPDEIFFIWEVVHPGSRICTPNPAN